MNEAKINEEKSLAAAEVELTDADLETVTGGTLLAYSSLSSSSSLLSLSSLQRLTLLRSISSLGSISNKEWQE